MKYIFVNPHSGGGGAQKKWNSIKAHFKSVKIIEDVTQFDFSKMQILENDVLISAGGDGTLHHLVNQLYKNFGLNIFKQITIGHIGLGSNNSYLRPYKKCQILNNIPMQISDSIQTQDVLILKIKHKDTETERLCISNGSLGFLANANLMFNSSRFIHLLKKLSHQLADMATFVLTLLRWNSLKIELQNEQGPQILNITNFHFMKRPFYAADMCFPEQINPSSGKMQINTLLKIGRLELFFRFFEIFIFQRFSRGRHYSYEIDRLKISSKNEITLEMDGEILFGNEFSISCLHKGLNLCQ